MVRLRGRARCLTASRSLRRPSTTSCGCRAICARGRGGSLLPLPRSLCLPRRRSCASCPAATGSGWIAAECCTGSSRRSRRCYPASAAQDRAGDLSGLPRPMSFAGGGDASVIGSYGPSPIATGQDGPVLGAVKGSLRRGRRPGRRTARGPLLCVWANGDGWANHLGLPRTPPPSAQSKEGQCSMLGFGPRPRTFTELTSL